MGVFAQVGLLLWKNAKLKIRSPLLTVTTLLWPIVIFVIIAVIRDKLPPVPNKECHFKPHALPSVGTVDFLQSMMCDLETKCVSADEVPKSNEPPTYGASIGALLDDLEPLFSEESSIVDDLESLSETLGPLINLTQALEETFNKISEQNFGIGDFFTNRTKLKEDLYKTFEGAEADLIESMLGARINVLELLDVIGYSDSSSLVCNATALQTYVIFPPNTNVDNIASALCNLKRKDIENIINIILQELDVHYIADEVTAFLRALDPYGLDNFTRDVLDIRNQLENITGLGDFVDVLPQVLQLTWLVPDIQRFLEAIQEVNIEETLYVLRRIIATIDWEGSPPWWSDVQDILFRITDIVSSAFDMILDNQYGDVTFKNIFSDGKVIEDVLKAFNVSRDSLAGLLNSTINYDKISDFIVLLNDPGAYCRGETSLDDLLTTEGAVDRSKLKYVLCKLQNGTSFLEALLDEFSAGRRIDEILQNLQRLFQPLGPGLDLGPLINQTLEIFKDIELLPDFIKQLPSLLTNLDDPQLSPLINLITLFQNQSVGNLQGVLIDLLVQGSTLVESVFTQYDFWPMIQGQLAYQIIIMDAVTAIVRNVIDGALVDAFKDDPFTQVGELFLEFGPNITEAIVSTFLDPAKLEELLSMSPEELQLVLCSDFIEYPPGLDVTYAKQELCKLNPDELYPSHIEVWTSYFPEVVYAIELGQLVFTGDLSSYPPEILANATFKNVIDKQLEFQELLEIAFQTEIDIDEFFAGLSDGVEVTGTADEWNAMLNRLVANSIPALQESVLIGDWESVLDFIEDIPEVHSFIAAVAIQDIIIQDLNDVLSLFNSLSRGEVLPYGGEAEKLLRGIVFMTQQGNAVQAAIFEAYQDPAKALVLDSTTDITLILCNATLRDSLLDLTSIDVDVLDSSLCSVNFDLDYFDLLLQEAVKLLQVERLHYLFYYIKDNRSDPIDLNMTDVTIHTNELVKTIGELDESWQNVLELVGNGSDWLSLVPQFTPQPWMDTWDTMFNMTNISFSSFSSFENLTAILQEFDPRNLTLLIEDLVITMIPGGEVLLHKAATMEYIGIQAMQGANDAFRLLQGVSEGMIIQDFQGTEVAKIIEALLEVDLIQLSNALSDPEVITVVSQVGVLPFFCNATIRDVTLDLPGKGIDTSLFDRTICTVEWNIAAEELYAFLYGPEVEQLLQEFTNASNGSLKPSDIDWNTGAAIMEIFIKNLANVTGIVQGLGEQLDIQATLAYFEQQWITDLLGVYPTNDTDVLDVLARQLSMVWKQLDDSLADIPGWDQYRTNVYIILSVIEQITSGNGTTGVEPFTLAGIVPNVTEFLIILREIPNLSDDIIYQLLYAPIDPVMLIGLASSNSWNETLCNADLLRDIFIEPAGLNLTQLQGALCNIDFEALIGQLSQGVGIEHLISMIIDQITSFSGGDDFGIGDYDPAQWASRFEQLIQSYDVQNIQGFIQSLASEFLMIYKDIEAQLVNVTGWMEFKADLTILMTVLKYTTPFLGNGTNGDEPIFLSMLVPNATALEFLLAQNTPFSRDIIDAFIYTPINPTKLIELAISNNWNTTLCTEEGLRMLFVLPEGLNVTELQGALCSVDFQNTLMELLENGAIENVISVIIDQLYLSIIPELTLPDFDLTALADLIPRLISVVQTGNMQNIGQYFESLNSLTAMFSNETWYQDTIRQLQFMDFITKTFADKIIMLEGRSITFPELGNLLANSSEIQRILLDDYSVSFGIVEAMMTLSLQPEKLISFFNMSNPFVTLCATGQFSSFFYSPLNPEFDIASLEQAICKIDFEQLVMEFKDLVSFDEILEQIQLSASTNQTGPYNWTAAYVTDERLTQAISQLTVNPPELTLDEVWVNKTLETLISLGDRLNKAQERLSGVSPSDISSSFDSLAEILEQGIMANQSWAIEMASSLRTINGVLGYTNNKLWPLPGRNITLQDLLPPDIATYIESTSDLTPDVIALLLHSSVNTAALLVANATWLDALCSDAQNLPMMLQLPPDVDVVAAHQAICYIDYDQWSDAYEQEIQSILIEVESGKEVNFTSITENFQKLSLGIQTLIENPPTLLKYNEEWFQSIIQRTGAILQTTFNDTRFYTDPNSIPLLLNEMWNQIAVSDPSLLIQARMNDYFTQIILDNLKMFPGRTYTFPRLDELFGDTTYVRELLSHSDIAPEIIDTFMTLAVDQQKIVYLVSTPNVFLELCQSGEFSTFFQLPPDSPTDITLVEDAFCMTNLTLVLAELDQKFKFSETATKFQRIISSDPTLPPFNQTAASLRMMELSNLITALIETPPTVTVDLVWWENVYNRSEVIVLQWLQRLTDQAMNGSSVPGLELVLAQLGTLDIPGFDVDQFEMWIGQTRRIPTLITQLLSGQATNASTAVIVPILQELFPDPDLIRELLNSTGLSQDVIEVFLQMRLQLTKWLPMLTGSDPLTSVCEGGLFKDIFLLANTSIDIQSIDIQSIEDQICSLNLTDLDGLFSELFMSDIDAVVLELVKVFYQVPGLDLQTALNVSREISAIISNLISDPTNFELNPMSIIELLQSLDIPGLNETSVQDWLKQVQLMQYINDVIADLLASNNGTEFAIPTFNELFPDPTIVVQLLTDLGVPSDVTEAFLYMAVQADQWTEIWMKPDPLQAVCDTSLFQDIFTQTLNSSIDIQTIQATLCSLNLSDIDALLNDIFKANGMIVQLVQVFYQVPGFDLQTALNVSQEISAIISNLISDPTNFGLNPMSIIELLQSLDIPGLNETSVQDWLKQVQLMQYINDVIADLLASNNGTEFAIPTFNELFPDPTIVVQLLTDLGVPNDVTEAFLYMAVQADQWTEIWMKPDPLQAVCDSSLFQDIFTQTLNSSIDIQTIQATLCSLNLSDIDALLNDIFKANGMIVQLVQVFYQVPGFDLQTALNFSREISAIISNLISDPTNFNLNPMSIIELLQSLDIPGLNETSVQDWLKQVQLMQYINDVIADLLASNNGTEFAIPTFNELFPDPTIVLNLLTELGVPYDITEAFLYMAVQADQWTEIWMKPDPLQAVCNTSLFQDIFTQTLNSSIDIQTIQATLCSLNLSDIDALLNDIFKVDSMIVQLVQVFYQVPDFDLQTALNVSREISEIISNLISDPTNFKLDPQSFITLLQSLRVPGLNETWIQDWLNQVQLTQYINDIIAWLASSNGTEFAIPTFNELFPDPTIAVQLLTDLGVPSDVTEAFLYMAVQADQWTEIWMKPDPLQAVCNMSLFQDIFTQTLNSSIDIQTIQATLCSLNLSDIDVLLNDIFKANGMIVQLVQVFYQVPDFDLQTALNVSREISAIISNLISNPANFELDPQSIIELLQSLDVPGLNETWIQDWLKQVQLMQYINDVIADLLASNNGTEFAIPTFNELFPDPTVIVQLLTDLGVPNDITEAFLYMAVQADQWTEIWMKPDPLQAVCDSSLFQDIFTQTLNSSIDIQTIQATLCSLNLSDIDALLNDIFKANGMIVQLVQVFYQVPDFDLQTALNVSREISAIISNLISDPTNFELNPQSIIEILQSLRVPGLNETWVKDWLKQVQLMQYINDVIADLLASNNGTEFAIPTFNELFPDPTVIVQLLTDLGVPNDITEAFLYIAVQADQWTEIWMKPDPLQAVCDSSLFQDIFTQTLNSSIDIQTIQATLCSLNLSDIDALLNDIFKTDSMIVQLVQVFYQVPDFDLQTALNVSREISAIISNLISNPANFELNPQSIIELLQSLDIPGLNETWVRDWVKQVQLMQYINDVIADLLASNNGTEFAIPTFNELFPDPTVIVQLLTDLGVSSDITEAFLYMAVQADQWTEIWMKPDPLQAVCDTSLFQDIFTQTLNSSIDIQTIQATLCSLNLSDIDALLNDIFKANSMIVQISLLLFNDPTMDWATAWNISIYFSQMFDELFQNPPMIEQDIKQLTLSLFSELENMLRMYGVWDEAEHYLKYVEFYLQVVGHHLGNSNNFLKDLFDPTVSLDSLVRYVGMSPEEIRTALLGDLTDISFLADLYYGDGDWNYLFYCDDKEQFESNYNTTNDEFLDLFAVREAFCSLNISEFFETAKNIYGFDFLRLTELNYMRSRNSSSPGLDIESLVDVATDIAQMITDLANLPSMLTEDLDLDFFVMRLTNLSNAIDEQDYQQLIVLLGELAPLLRSPDIVYQIQASLMSSSDILSWFESIDSTDPVTWLERIEGALNETLLWHTILPALNFVDLLIESDLDALNPLGYKYYDLITNETALQQYLTDLLGLAPEYAEAITLSGVKDVLVLADHHLSGTWESTYCVTVDSANGTDLNLTAVYSLLCNLDREQFFESLNTLMGIDVLRLTQWIGDVTNPERDVVQRFDWQTLVGNVQSYIDTLTGLTSIGQIGGVNVTQVENLIWKLQQGIEQFDYEVLIEQMEILNQILYLNGEWDNIKGYMNSVTNIVEWINPQLENAHANNVTLIELITHHATVLQNLYYALGSDLFPQLITALVNPQQAMTLNTHDDIETVVCDADSFNELIKPTIYPDTNLLQMSLCSHLMSGHPTIANDLMTHFNIAPLEHELAVLATNNFEQGFQDQDIDMRRMVNEFEKLSKGLILITVRDVMNHAGLNITMLPAVDNLDDILIMVSGALTGTLPALPLWDEVFYPILGRLDLAMIMVEDLFFSLPDREAEIQTVLDNETIVTAAIPVILTEVPKVIMAWNQVMEQPLQIPVLSKLIIELLKGSFEGISEDPSYLSDFLTPVNSTNGSSTAVFDLIVSLNTMLVTDFGQQLMDVFRIRENAERLDIITDFESKDLPPFDAASIGRSKDFVEKAIDCATTPDGCIVDLQAPPTLDLLVRLIEIPNQLPEGSLESLGDVFVILAPIVEDLFQQLGNGTGEFENSLNLVFSFLRTVFESNKVPLTDVLSIFEFEEALLNGSSIYQFLKENTDLTEIDLMALRNSSINATVLFKLFDLGVKDSVNLPCNEALLDDLLLDVDSTLKEEILKGLCSNGTLVAVEFFRTNIDLKTVIDLVYKNAGQTFPEFLLETFNAIGNLSEVDYEALGEFVAIVLPALFDDGVPTISDLDTLAENINITIRALRSVDALLTLTEGLFSNFPSYRDVQQLIRTLLDNIYVLELLAEIPDLTVNNILKDERVLQDFLVENTALRQSEARDITYATFNLEQLFLTEVTELLEKLCDPDYLSTILIFSNQTNATILADTMCGLSGDQIATLIETALPFIDVSAIVNVSYLADSFGGAFSISNETISQVLKSIESLEAVTMALPALQKAIASFNDDPAIERLREMAELGFFTGEEISAVTQEIVCGSTSLRKRRAADDVIRTFGDATITENKDDFCVNIFSSIVDGIDGRLVWAYLKPIVEGSILYSPDIPPVRRIIEKANSTFENIALTRRFAEVWLKSEGDLGTALDPDTLTATMTLLENSYVQGLLEDQYGINSDLFTDVLSGNLTSMDPGQIQTLNLLAELVSNLTTCFNLNRFVGYDNEAAMVEDARSFDKDNTLLAALAFDIPADATELPAHIKYKIRMDSDNTPPTDMLRDIYLTRSSASDFVFDLRYLRGYIMLQDMVEGSIVSLQASPDIQPPGVYLQMTPYPCFLNDEFGSIFTLLLPLVMTISFVVLIGVMTHQLVYEKERGIEELMKVMGLPAGANWWAWFISNSLLLVLLSCVVVIIMKYGNILPMTDWSLLLVFILDYFFSLIMFCYLASAVFQRASIASLASILVYLIFYLPYIAIFASESLLDALWKLIVPCIFFPSTFSIGCLVISQFENMGVGAQWHLIWNNALEEEITSMAFVLIALAVDGAIYLILGWYIKTIFPGKYGVPRKWYFPLQPSFWCPCSMSKKHDMQQYINSAFDPESGVALTSQDPVVEEEPSNLPVGIAILNLTKVYRSCFKVEKVAVDSLTLNFFEGQVTAVLGHNGAGKTTTINIITGLFPATSGKVYLQGVNVSKKAMATRENLGVCVQHNALYENLTVREHMAMTGRVKGLRGKALDDDIYNLLQDVGLLKKSEERVKNLSGGMKRKLSVAMAFVGHSTIIILDEPTSGVDPHARRAIWNLIMKQKTGRTIVLCTHFMDEADILGDRIAILDQGHLRCCGSPAFLKSRFSSGYRLSLAKEATSGVGTPTDHGAEDFKTEAVQNIYDTMRTATSDVPSTSSGIATDPGSSCDTSNVTDFIKARIPSARLQDDIGTELVYVLPVDSGEREKFQELFEDLDSSLGELCIKSYGISDTTLKEVFLKVSTGTSRSVDEETGILKNNNWSLRTNGKTFTIATGITHDKPYQPYGHLVKAVLLSAWGILIKRLHFVRRDWQGLIWTILMPVVLVALAIGFSQLSQLDPENQRQLTPAMFNPNSFAFFSDESESEIGQRLTDALINPPGLGTTCMADADQKDLYPCVESNAHLIDQLYNYNLSLLAEVPEDRCRCTETGFGQECEADAGGIPPPTWLTDTQVFLQDISVKEDKDRYLLDTQNQFRNSRFGGVSWFDDMESNQTQAKAWYNNRAYHAMPTFLNVMNNIILRATVNNNSHEYGITAYNHPLKLSKQDLGVNIWLDAAKNFGIVIVIVAALVLIPSAFSMFLVNENINGSKRLHYVSGVGTLTYWLTNLFWDMLSFCIPVGLMLLVFYIFDFRGLILTSNVGAFVALVFLYGFATMCQIYILIPFFKESGTAFIFLFCLLLLAAVITNLPNFLVLVNAVSEREKRVFEILNYVFLMFSPYCLSSGLLALIQNQALADIYRAFGMEEGIYEDPFLILQWHFVALAAEGGLAFLVLLIVDAVRNSACSSCLDPNVDNLLPGYNDNEDVREEMEMVNRGGSKEDALVLTELRKVYRGPGRQKIVAVNDLCLAVSKGECFGLLGVNGAGKTSTFRMIVEDLSPTEGTIKKRAKSIGYCPQENAMYPQLTGEELLYCYARMKGINSSGMSKAIEEICQELGMEKYLRRRISTYSGGMKRSLAVAVALLGKPELILMDEPTTGMDPITKQRVLNSIVNVVRDNRSVILTSHSMEECEAVCTRLAIMVNGQFCCLGSPQHVKNRHGNGYSLVVRGQKMGKTDMSLITEFVHRSFPGAELKEHHHNVVRFQLPPHNITVATIFGIMEREKTTLNLEDYSVSQTTLDEVFVNFAKKQTDGLDDETSSTASAHEVSIINRAFEPDQDLDVDVFPQNTNSAATQL